MLCYGFLIKCDSCLGGGGRRGPIRLVGMSELQPIIPARDDNNPGGSLAPATQHDPIEAPPITEEEVGEYREQDRFLPVCLEKILFHQPLTAPSR